MADETILHTTLRAYAGFANLIGGLGTAARLYDQVVPDNVAQPVPLPFVTVTTVDDVPQNTLDGSQLAGKYRVQFDIYAASKASALTVLVQLRFALQQKGYEIVRRDNLPTSDPKLKRISSDWDVVIER